MMNSKPGAEHKGHGHLKEHPPLLLVSYSKTALLPLAFLVKKLFVLQIVPEFFIVLVFSSHSIQYGTALMLVFLS